MPAHRFVTRAYGSGPVMWILPIELCIMQVYNALPELSAIRGTRGIMDDIPFRYGYLLHATDICVYVLLILKAF